MSGPFGSSQWMYNAGGGFYDYEIDGSLRFDGVNSSPYLSRAVSHNRKTFTVSFWLKRSSTDRRMIYGVYSNSADTAVIGFENDGHMSFYDFLSGYRIEMRTDMRFRDVGTWYHVVWAIDTTQATASNRMKLYVNGEQVTSFSTATYPSQNLDLKFGAPGTHAIGTEGLNVRLNFHGYFANWALIDGQQLDASYFGEFKSGIWIPKDVSGLTYGTGGYLLEFAGNTNDTSGEGNNWTANNISSYDYVPDSPTNNFNTFSNVIPQNSGSLSEGSLKSSSVVGGASNQGPCSTYNVKSGKWYFEFRITGGSEPRSIYAGAAVARTDNSLRPGRYVAAVYDGGIYNVNGSLHQGGLANPATNDVFGFATDMDNLTCQVYRNGSTYGTQLDFSGSSLVDTGFMGLMHNHGSSSTNSTVVVNYGQDSTFAGATTAGGNTDDNGYGDFKYAPPSGFLAMCSANLPDPAIDPAQDESPADYFDTILYTAATSNGTYTHGNLSFQPDFSWIKNRNNVEEHYLIDVVRGNTSVTNKFLNTNSLDTEGAAGVSGTTFSVTSTGYEFIETSINSGELYFNGRTYAGWNWKAGGTASSNTDGSITSSVSANQDAGFSIVTYSGNGTNGATVGHGLGATPKMIIFKIRNDGGDNWTTYHAGIASDAETDGIFLNLTNAPQDNAVFFNDTAPTSSVFSLGTNHSVNSSSGNYVAYCFADKDGFSKAGSYTGNSSSDGTFVYTGFRPAWVMIKRTDSTNNWYIFNNKTVPYNSGDTEAFLRANTTDTETTSLKIDLLSNGFKPRDASPGFNTGSYIYLAFAEQPFKYANAR